MGCAESSVTNFSQPQSAELARKNAGIAGPTSSFFNAAMAAVAKKSVFELSKQPTSFYFAKQSAHAGQPPTYIEVATFHNPGRRLTQDLHAEAKKGRT